MEVELDEVVVAFAVLGVVLVVMEEEPRGALPPPHASCTGGLRRLIGFVDRGV